MAVYACSDLHGMLHFYKAIKDRLEPEDKVYFLGDAGDRGPHSWETIKAILDDPQFIYIKGNHEDMLVDALGKGYGRQYNLLRSNGGKDTYHQCLEESDWADWRIRLKELPTHAVYVNAQGETVYLSHAGYTPWVDEDGSKKWNWDQELLWSREHFLDKWPEDEKFQKAIIVHGHTPIPYLLDEIDPACQMGEIEPGALWYAGGKKCCIDCGAVFTGYCVLLNLDTWDEDVFCSDPYIS
jgi:calcineurin-like phosphoesterase family protein